MASEVHCAVQRVSCLSISQSSVIEIGLIIRGSQTDEGMCRSAAALVQGSIGVFQPSIVRGFLCQLGQKYFHATERS